MWIFIVIGLVFWVTIAVGVGILLGQTIRRRDKDGHR